MTIAEMKKKLAEYDEEEVGFKAEWDKTGGFSLGEPQFVSFPERQQDEGSSKLLGERDLTMWHHQRYRPHTEHMHSELHFAFLLSGTGENITEGESVTLSAGDICIITPGAWHLPIAHGDSVMVNFIIRRSWLETLMPRFKASGEVADYLRSLAEKRHYKFLHIKSSEDTLSSELCERLLLAFVDPSPYDSELEQKALFEALLCRLMRLSDELTTHSRSEFSDDNTLSSEISAMIAAEYRTLTLDELAERLGYTKTHLCRVIKATRGTTFSSLVNRLRIEDARKLLRETSLSVSEIAYDCGFASVEYFTRSFKRLLGVSPGEYRRVHV